MQLSRLLENIVPNPSNDAVVVSRLELDSRRVQPGDLFLAVKGTQVDGSQYIADALAKGAVAAIPVTPEQVGLIAARFYDEPAKQLRLMGVTGTNGKTSCSHFFAQALQVPCGVIGTLGSGIYGALGEAGLTTPDAVSLQKMLHQFAMQGVQTVAMEVSSHSIDQARISGIEFELGLFTNLTQDHLDYHGTMECYAAVKRRFLAESCTKQIIVNADDPMGKKWIAELAGVKPVFSYSVCDRSSQVFTKDAEFSLQGIKATIQSPWGEGELSVPLIGQFNLSNVLAVFTALCVYGIPFQEVLRRLQTLKPVPGRMQTFGGVNQPLVVVDYAHTPDALEKVLQALRAHTPGKLVCVFGCGGERDQGKRPMMAKIAEQWADTVIVTNDNPRHEQPEEIAKQIVEGFSDKKHVFIELDRSKAIENSIQWANHTDCVLIAGKGAERYQQIGDDKIPFEDASHVLEKLNVSVVK